jgi:hypothetical protein
MAGCVLNTHPASLPFQPADRVRFEEKRAAEQGEHQVARWAAASMCLLVSLYGPVVRLPQPVLDIAVHAHPEVPECGVRAHPHGAADRHGRHRTFCGFGTFQRRDIG